MTREEFLALFGERTKENEKFFEALEKALDEAEAKHSEKEDLDEANHSDDSEEAIEHYGVDGQKWGVRNGPPYPLSRQKPHIGRRDKARILIDNLDDLSMDDIRTLMSRIELEEKLERMAADDRKKGESAVTRILKKSGDAVLSTVVPAVTVYVFKKIVEGVAGEDVVSEMFPKKK